MVAKQYTTGDVATASGSSHRHVLNVLESMGMEVERTEKGHRRFTKAQAKKLKEEIITRRSNPRYMDL